MNLTQVLDNALPEIPARQREFYPKVHPELIGREHRVRGQPQVAAVIRRTGKLFRFTPDQWAIIQLFNGQRSCEQVSELFQEERGIWYAPDDIREFVGELDAVDFWFKTPLEQNIAVRQKLSEERQKKVQRKSKWGDLSHVDFSVWDPDAYLSAIYPKLKFIYSKWFTALSLIGLALTVYIFVDRWSEIGPDTLFFFNFREKNFWDLFEFWWLTCFVLFVHESAHGLTCKHYGSEVHKMGFNLLYLTPCFFTDASEVFVFADKWQRIKTVVWGAWSEILICIVVTPIWWATPRGSLVNSLCYKLMLITGFAVILLNWNPLLKLDGYYLLTEILEIPALKEESTAYVTNWVKRHIFRLPVVVPFVPKRRRVGYATYAILSGLYSYSLLYLVARVAGDIARHYSPDWGFLVTIAVAYRIFRSRIHSLVRFMKNVYLDKRERVRAWLTPPRLALMALIAAVLFIPLRRESVEARFVLEPQARVIVRAEVPGTVSAVLVDEDQRVAVGSPVAHLRNLQLESEAARAQAEYRVASAKSVQSQLEYKDFGPAERQREQLGVRSRMLAEQVAKLQLTSPISGVVVTPRIHDSVGAYLRAGSELLEVADLSMMRARVYLPEFAIQKAKLGAAASLLAESSSSPSHGYVVSIAPAPSEIAAGLISGSRYKALQPPNFYVLDILVKNPDESLKAGMAGTAKIYGERRGVAGWMFERVRELVDRKVW